MWRGPIKASCDTDLLNRLTAVQRFLSEAGPSDK